ncbi:MAG: hypothetical protein V8Q81_08125 [Christensenellales bacterium]
MDKVSEMDYEPDCQCGVRNGSLINAIKALQSRRENWRKRKESGTESAGKYANG